MSMNGSGRFSKDPLPEWTLALVVHCRTLSSLLLTLCFIRFLFQKPKARQRVIAARIHRRRKREKENQQMKERKIESGFFASTRLGVEARERKVFGKS